MLTRRLLHILIAATLVLAMNNCSSNSTGTDDGGGGNDNDTETYTLNVTVDPSGAGTTDPSNDTFESGTDVTVEAFPKDGWAFNEWTGDIQSQDNPLTFTIEQNTSLTANFNSVSSIYDVELVIADSANTQKLYFGQKENTTSGFDSGEDVESPPAPPQDAMYLYFKSGGKKLLHDYRSFTAQSETWNLQFAQVRGDSLQLSWNRATTRLTGTITIRTADSSVQVDMVNNTSLKIATADADSMLIDYELTN